MIYNLIRSISSVPSNFNAIFFDFIKKKFFFHLILGNYDRKGVIRQRELWNSCRILNIHDENVTIIRATNLPDDPTLSWKSQIIAKQVLKQVESLDIDAIVTFDRDGISHHVNHCAIYYATASICISGLVPDGMYFIVIMFSYANKKQS